MNTRSKKTGFRNLPYAIGGSVVVMFLLLTVWQTSRGLEKRAQREAFESQTGFAALSDGMAVTPFSGVKATGSWLAERQVLLENISMNGRQGYYVLTPLQTGTDEPLLIVNRGWIARGTDIRALQQLRSARITTRGKVGSIPRAGFRMGEPFADRSSWPRSAVFPTLAELAAELGQPVQPFVLLLDPEETDGYVREWVPEDIGPGRHFAYALQWFSMGLVLAALLIINYRKKGLEK